MNFASDGMFLYIKYHEIFYVCLCRFVSMFIAILCEGMLLYVGLCMCVYPFD